MSDVLGLTIMGVPAVVRFGPAVSAAQVADLTAAWSRCLAAPDLVPAAVDPVLPGLPFTAAVTFQPQGRDLDVRQLCADTFESLAERLTSQLTLLAIEANAGTLTMLHACGLSAAADSSVMALVAKSGTGKTTAATHLAKTFGYVTDETVAVTSAGEVLAYPKPLSVKGTVEGQPKTQTGPDSLGLAEPTDGLWLRGIGLLDRQPGSQAVSVAAVPLLEAVMELIPNTSSQALLDKPLQSLCALIERTGGVRRFTYAEAADLVEVFHASVFGGAAEGRHASAPVPAPGAWTGVDCAGSDDPVPNGWVVRCNAADAVESDGDILVLNSAGVTRLSGIGPTVWAATERAITEDQLIAVLEREHGLPDGYQAMLEEVLVDLASRGIIGRGPGESFWGGPSALGVLNLASLPAQ